jgi:predicted amidohydrolase YtcJ
VRLGRRLPCAALLLASVAASAQAPPADLVLLGADVYTVDAARSWAQAVAVRDGRLVYVGTEAGAGAFVGPATVVRNLPGGMVLPAFHDSHVHPLSGGVELARCDLNNATSREEVFARVRAYAAAHPQDRWIVGGGWDLPLFPNAAPTRQELDALVPDRPAFLSAADGHTAWVNSAALRAADVTAATADPPNGRIEREAGSRQPSGTLREDAMELVTTHLPPWTAADREEGLRRGLALAASFGIAALVDASVDADDLAAYRALEARGELTARVVASLYWDPVKGETDADGQLAELARLRASCVGPRLRATAVKIFADGVIEAGTAALLDPYMLPPAAGASGAGQPDTARDRGMLNLTPEAFARAATRVDQAGFQIHVHAIGDRAIRVAFDALAAARAANGPRDARHHLAHIQLFEPADVPRFRQLGVIANFQGLWAYADPYITDLTEPVLGAARSRWLYPMRSVADTGAMIVGGSDWSVSSMNPLDAIEVAITRRDPAAGPGAAWIPEERIGLDTAIAAYTINGAYLAFDEAETGSLEVGKAADLIVLDRNLFAIPAEQISDTKVLLTLLAGRETYRAPTPP